MIFVFSGTGNSYSVAQRISEATGVRMVDLATAVRYKRYGYDAAGEDVGFVFPVYYYGLPRMVAELAENIVVRNPGRVFAVATCGEESGGACEMLAEKLDGNRYLFRNVPKERVLRFLNDFDRPRVHYASSPDMSIRWMMKVDDDTMGDFSVVLSGNAKPIADMERSTIEFCDGKYRVNKITRNPSDSSSTWVEIKTVRDKADMIADLPKDVLDSFDEDDRTKLLKGDIRIRNDAKRKSGLKKTPLLAIYVARTEGCENDVVMASWYIPKDAKSEEEFDPAEYVYLEEEDL